MYAQVGEYTKWVQTLAIAEIFHILLGLNRSSLVTSVIQVSSRILLVWGVCDKFDQPKMSPGYTSMLIAWSVTEVVRYTYYVVNLLKGQSGLLTWARYVTVSDGQVDGREWG